MWDISDYIVIIICILGFIFPSQMIRAIRENDTDKSNTHRIIAAFVFGCMMLLIGMLLNR